MDDTEYFANPAVDQTQLKQFLTSPAEWAFNRLHPQEASTPAFQFGTAFHALTLHTDPQVVTYPEGMSPLTKAGKQWKTDEEDAGHLVISRKDYDFIQLMQSNLEDTDRKTLDDAECEKAVIITDSQTGIPVKIKIDALPADTSYVIDLKTTCHLDDFARSMVDYGYHIQAAFYLDVLAQAGIREANRFEFWNFTKTGSGDYRKSFLTAVDDGSDSFYALQAGRRAYRNALTKMSEMMDILHLTMVDELAQALWADRRVDHAAQGIHLKSWQKQLLDA